jgi:hypothetical protein
MRRVFVLSLLMLLCAAPFPAFARDVRYESQEVSVYVSPNEPTEVEFPDAIAMGYKRRDSVLTIDKRENDLVVSSNEAITEEGEALIVRLKDGRSYSLRIHRASEASPRDNLVKLLDSAGSPFEDESEELPTHVDRQFPFAKSTQVAGLMREMVLASEFGKTKIPGYRVSERYKGETILNDGTMDAKIEKIFIGPNLWGYVLNAGNLLDEGQRINPATFRLDGTRAISAENWELAPRPMNVEQQISGDHTSKVYIVTRAKKSE